MTATKESKDVSRLKKLIQRFFDAINAADTKALASHFFPAANLTILRQDPPLPPSGALYPQYESVPSPAHPSSSTTSPNSEDEKITVVIQTTIEKFIEFLDEGKKRREGKPDLKIYEEPNLDATDILIDNLFGMAWCPFKVTFDGVLHHYGTLVYTFGKVDGENGEKVWRINTLSQNYRRTPGWDNSEFV